MKQLMPDNLYVSCSVRGSDALIDKMDQVSADVTDPL